jgi:hypothetical protein
MRKLTTEQFIQKAKEIHGDKYDYSQVNYVNCVTKIKIICQIHGFFYQMPSSHLQGCGCKKCSDISGRNIFRKTNEQFIQKAKEIHGDKYDYSQVNYVNNITNIVIVCLIHGKFNQLPYNHINLGCGCPKCGRIKSNIKTSLTTEQFIQKAKEIHGDKYDYSQVNYVNGLSKVKIICKEHGKFWQIPNNHISRGDGCPKCASTFSKPEEELRQFIQLLVPSAYKTRIGEIIPKQELDVFIPELKIAFEFQGEYWHKHHHVDVEERDERKRQSCQKLEIKLYEIWENDWINHRKETENQIKQILNI